MNTGMRVFPADNKRKPCKRWAISDFNSGIKIIDINMKYVTEEKKEQFQIILVEHAPEILYRNISDNSFRKVRP